MRNLVAAIAAAGLIAAPVAASANTRASASVPAMSAPRSLQPVRRAASPAAQAEQIWGTGALYLLGAAIFVGTLVAVSGGKKRSRGA